MIRHYCDICGEEICESGKYDDLGVCDNQPVDINISCHPVELKKEWGCNPKSEDKKYIQNYRTYKFNEVCNECRKRIATTVEEMLRENDK